MSAPDVCRCEYPLYAFEGEASYQIGDGGKPVGTGMRVRRFCSRCNKDLPAHLRAENEAHDAD